MNSHYYGDNSYLIVNGKKYKKYILIIKISIILFEFAKKVYLKTWIKMNLKRYILNKICFNYHAIERFEILKINKYLMVENKTK